MTTPIPLNITNADILKAVQETELSAIPPRRFYTKYYLVVEGKKYPPKYILSRANQYANGQQLGLDAFTTQQAVAYFSKMGFQVEKREEVPSYFDELSRFLEQTQTDDLKSRSYQKSFNNLKVKVSFGQGVKADVPWIAFLKEPNTVQKGIYPVYLFYKNLNLLVLAYGVSQTHKPPNNWKLRNPTTITKYFAEHHLGKPTNYGSSYVYKVYNTNNPLNRDEIEEDLLDIIDLYNEMQEDTDMPTTHTTTGQQEFQLSAFLEALHTTGLSFNPALVTRFVGALLAKPFVILTGLSGSGKTRLAQAFVQWICEDAKQYCIVPVGADWTNREPLLGYPNALDPQEYIKPDNGALELLLYASAHANKPCFLILDEMNLSHVERYFADFLSIMESQEAISLHAGGAQKKSGVPAAIKWPANLFIIGTVNIDETTNMFSPKVLDRANTIEFRVTAPEMAAFLNNTRTTDKQALHTTGASGAGSFLALAGAKEVQAQGADRAYINQTLISFFKELKKTGAEFGYRTATEILQLLHQLEVIDQNLSLNQKLDMAIMQKLLPKLHGSRRKLIPVLSTLGALCFKGSNLEKEVFETDDFDYETDQVLFPLSLEKITRMYKGAIDNGFASFAEA
ncbi:DUF3578 domain-containing protein [Niabella pedocola]|uniref:DUF3578 domain-containing protein n=1 Tax=Niabella pedocola TaxID=1752077 RepID=A0ABS8PPP1_9BACT|nr:DUF3578 domain-containing protein [Niabella pedocola]MCD2421791.1 DUF3578 domain-containing protein [Niabella pedocola]